MKASKTGLALPAVAIALFALPAAAQAEYLIPPGNSAATQYTEAVPTAGGPKATNPSKHGKAKTPKHVLGNGNVAKLNAQGAEGRAVAEVAAETAPGSVAAAGAAGAAAPTHGTSHTGIGGDSPGDGSVGADAGGGGPSGAGAIHSAQGINAVDTTLTSQEIPDGSSGLGEVLGQATGSSNSGQLGLLLPLIVLATIAWSVAYLSRQRKRPTQ